MVMTLDDLTRALAPSGLMPLGAFRPEPADDVPGGEEARAVVLVGNAGPDMWRVFSAEGLDGEPEPLDRWTRRVLDDAAADLRRRFRARLRVFFPFDGPPYRPFQRWAMRSGTAHATPIGPLIHAVYGTWHAYRGAFVIETPFDAGTAGESASPCLACPDKPCLNSCPVSAFTEDGYDVPACAAWLDENRRGDCMTQGCRARRACPVGRDYHYQADHARFHMQRFLQAHS